MNPNCTAGTEDRPVSYYGCMRRWAFGVAVCLGSVAASVAQSGKLLEPAAQAPAAKPAVNSPSLEITMKFIQDKLNEIGSVNYTVTFYDPSGSFTGGGRMSVEKHNVVADPVKCQISYHATVEIDHEAQPQTDYSFPLREVRSIVVMKAEKWIQDYGAGADHPGVTVTVSPEIYFLVARRIKGNEDRFAFNDEEMANRVAKALIHAVDLCSASNQPDPF